MEHETFFMAKSISELIIWATRDDLYSQLYDIRYFSDGEGGGIYPSCWDEDDDFWSALPDLNRGPPDGCLQPCVSSLQSVALAN